MKYGMEELKMDKQGRIIIPIEWRKGVKTNRFTAIAERDYIKIIPKRKSDLTRNFDTIKVEVKSQLEDWHSVKRELMAKKLERY